MHPGMATARRIRLLQIVDSLYAGGMENIMVQVLNRLDPERFDATVCCLSRAGPFAERLPKSVRCVVLGKAPGFQWQTVRDLKGLMRDGFDVVHTHHLGGLIYASLAKPWPRGPRLVHSEHILLEGWELAPKRVWQRRLLYRRASCVFTVSTQQLQQLQSHGLRHRTMFTLHNGVDSQRFHPPSQTKPEIRRALGLDPNAFWIGKVARFATMKRHLDLVEAFELAAVNVPSMRLLLVGDGGSEKEKVLDRIAASPARDRIHWAGMQQDPVPWYQAMDALVIASATEGLPNAALEAMACGLPVLSNDVCGIREIATPDEQAWIQDLSTIPRLATGLEWLVRRPSEDLMRMGMAAREHMQRSFSLDAMIAKYERLYSSVAQS